MNGLDVGLAFLEGLGAIVSPCILTVLPLVLAASVDGGRRRPYGVILGFVVAFSLVALAARRIVAGRPGAALRLHFTARKVFLVMGTSTGRPVSATIRLDGKDAGTVTVDRSTLYRLVDQKAPRSGLLEPRAREPRLEAYDFTFG